MSSRPITSLARADADGSGELLSGMPMPRAVRFHAVRFDAFKVDGSMGAMDSGATRRLRRLDAGDLREALNEALSSCALYHKDHLIIRETGEQGVKLRIFSIRKKATPRYVHKDHVTRAVRDLYADPVCVLDGGVIGAGL